MRAEAVRKYAFAIPTQDALTRILQCSPHGVVEMGAGTGYWAALLATVGVEVIAYDLAPAPSHANHLFAGREPWFDVQVGGPSSVGSHGNRTLLMVWPSFDEAWPAETLDLYHRSGGECVVYVGEPPGGLTGDALFHAELGTITYCYACAYGLLDSPCVCGAEQRWQEVASVDLPTWEGCDDRLYVFERLASGSVHSIACPRTKSRRWRLGKGSR